MKNLQLVIASAILMNFVLAQGALPPNCKTAHLATDPTNSGCQVCNPGYNRVPGAQYRILEDTRILQGAKTNFICMIPNCTTMHPSSDPTNQGCSVCSPGYVRAVGTITRLLEGEDRLLQGAKTNYVCNAPNCSAMHVSTDADAGCKTCAPGYVRAVGTITRLLEGEDRLLQGAKTNYVCNAPNCQSMHVSSDTSTGCKTCAPGYVRAVGTITRLLEGEDRLLQGAKTNYVCNAPNCSAMHVSTDADAGCKTCAPGYIRVEGVVARLLSDSRLLQGSKKNFVCSLLNCKTMSISTDTTAGCKECNPGFNRVLSPSRILESDKYERLLQGSKQNYICQSATPTPTPSNLIAMCKTYHLGTDADSGC